MHKKRTQRGRFLYGINLFFRRIFHLCQQPIFIFLTVLGHLYIALGAFTFWKLEHGENPNVVTFIDALYWMMTTVTTVGYGDIHAVTQAGRIVSILFMVGGVIIFWAYTALFATALVSPELSDFEKEIRELETTIEQLRSEE